MKKYILVFCALIFTTHQSNSMEYPEIAINTQGKAILTADKQGTRRYFVPIIVYIKGKLVCGTFIPWDNINYADDESIVMDTCDSSNKRYVYRCNQRHASGNSTFKQALHGIVVKTNEALNRSVISLH